MRRVVKARNWSDPIRFRRENGVEKKNEGSGVDWMNYVIDISIDIQLTVDCECSNVLSY